MSNLDDRRNGPRKKIMPHDEWASLRICVIMYAALPTISFIGSGHWPSLVFALLMLRIATWGMPMNSTATAALVVFFFFVVAPFVIAFFMALGG